MSKMYRNWPVHNIIAHPLSELAYWVARPFSKSCAERISRWVHDCTLPTETVCIAGNPTQGDLPCGDPDCVCMSQYSESSIKAFEMYDGFEELKKEDE